MRSIQKSLDYLTRFLEIMVVLIIIVISLSILIQIIGRYFFNASPAWTEELSRRMMIWLMFIASTIAFRRGAMMGVDVITGRLPKTAKRYLAIVMNILVAGFGSFLFWQGYLLMIKSSRQMSAALNIPMRYVYLVIPVSGALFVLFALENIGKHLFNMEERENTR